MKITYGHLESRIQAKVMTFPNKKPTLYIGTGWYSSSEERKYVNYGDDLIRSPDFRPLWWSCIKRFVKPDAVIIVDSASPVKSVEDNNPGCPVKVIELTINPGHSVVCPYHYSGWTSSVILSLEYAFACNADIYLYVEQDVLLYGDDLVNQIYIELSKASFVFGNGLSTPQILQQSFFAIHRRGMRRFLRGLHSIEQHDRDLSPETKFHIATASVVWSWLILFVYRIKDVYLFNNRLGKSFINHCLNLLFRLSRNYGLWSFGYGRTRPLDFNKNIFYFQHGSVDELKAYDDLFNREPM